MEPNFLEVMGGILIIILFTAILTSPMVISIINNTRNECASNGYSKYTEKLGETYCLKFNDGIISGIGLLDSERDTVTPLGIAE